MLLYMENKLLNKADVISNTIEQIANLAPLKSGKFLKLRMFLKNVFLQFFSVKYLYYVDIYYLLKLQNPACKKIHFCPGYNF